jgi:hypothetical protein
MVPLAQSSRWPGLLAGGLALACLGGCASPETESRWSRHFDGPIWGGALGNQVRRPDRLVPEATLLATIPLSFVYDSDIQHYYEQRPLDQSVKDVSTALQFILPAIPVTIGTVDWAHGDGGQNFEVVAESLGGVVLVQQIMARTISRERPDHSDMTSFPSGHTSWTFAATTLIVRDIHDPSDDSFHFVDALLYLPAIFSGWERIAQNHHWTSDVTCGAFLGMFLTNWIWDAHFGSKEEERPTIYMEEGHRGMAWRPKVDVIDGRLAFGVEIGL